MRTTTAEQVVEVEITDHEALALDCAERAAIRERLGSMIWAGERAGIRTRIGAMIWAGTVLDEQAAGVLADRILEFVESRLPARLDR